MDQHSVRLERLHRQTDRHRRVPEQRERPQGHRTDRLGKDRLNPWRVLREQPERLVQPGSRTDRPRASQVPVSRATAKQRGLAC